METFYPRKSYFKIVMFGISGIDERIDLSVIFQLIYED